MFSVIVFLVHHNTEWSLGLKLPITLSLGRLLASSAPLTFLEPWKWTAFQTDLSLTFILSYYMSHNIKIRRIFRNKKYSLTYRIREVKTTFSSFFFGGHDYCHLLVFKDLFCGREIRFPLHASRDRGWATE